MDTMKLVILVGILGLFVLAALTIKLPTQRAEPTAIESRPAVITEPPEVAPEPVPAPIPEPQTPPVTQ